MKFCLNCGHEIEDNAEICPYCGKKVSSKSYAEKKDVQNTNTNRNEFEINSNMKVLIYIFSVIFEIPGVVLLLIYGIKEMNFHLEYDLSELSEAGINVVRELSGNDLNIILIIVGIVLIVLGAIISSAPRIIKYSKK